MDDEGSAFVPFIFRCIYPEQAVFQQERAMVRFVSSLLAAGLLYLLPNSLQAQVPGVCADRGMLVERLGVKYSEKPVSIGLAADGSVVEVFASTSGTFTIVATQPTGMACILVTGENWEGLPAMKAGLKI